MHLIYDIAIALYGAAIRIASPFKEKAKKLVEGRRMSRLLISRFNRPEGRVVWFHVASLGEFEQGRPVIEALKRREPETHIVLTFFSPSGYEVRHDYKEADLVLYLPSDTKRNARELLDAIRPDMAIFVKYEYWYHILTELQQRKIPTYLISAIFLPSQPFFKWWGGIFREILGCFKEIFVQDPDSLELLKGIGVTNATIAGDTRFDRVVEAAERGTSIPLVEKFLNGAHAIISGSTWPPDEENLLSYINAYNGSYKWIIAPHELGETRIATLLSAIQKRSARITAPPDDLSECEVLIIDCIGILSAIYRYGDVAYIGGGFGAGIHNTLEAAVYGVPVIFGPNHKAFREAIALREAGGAFAYSTAEELKELLDTLLNSAEIREAAGSVARDFVLEHKGATEIILNSLSL